MYAKPRNWTGRWAIAIIVGNFICISIGIVYHSIWYIDSLIFEYSVVMSSPK